MFYFCSMDTDAEMKARHARLLARYAEQAASLADDLHAAALAAETPAEKQALSLAFHRTGRTLRQTLALEAKLRRDARLDARADEDRAREAAKAQTAARKSRVRAGVERFIWTEAEEEDQLDYLLLLEDRLKGDDLADPEEPIDALIHRIVEDLGLPSPLAGEGVVRSGSGEGSHGDPNRHPADSSAQPLIRPASAGNGLLPQGEKDDPG